MGSGPAQALQAPEPGCGARLQVQAALRGRRPGRRRGQQARERQEVNGHQLLGGRAVRARAARRARGRGQQCQRARRKRARLARRAAALPAPLASARAPAAQRAHGPTSRV